MRTLLTIFLVAALTFPAHAGTKVLGYEIGVSKLDEVRAKLEKNTLIGTFSNNQYTGGLTLKTKRLNDENLKENINYYFDDRDVLAAIRVYTFHRYYSKIFYKLEEKYKLVFERNAHVGDSCSRFLSADAVIDLCDPGGLSSDLSLLYVRKDIFRKYIKTKIIGETYKIPNDSSEF